MKWFYLAFLIWIFEIILFVSIIALPLCFWLRNNYLSFSSPFWWAGQKVYAEQFK
jgi:hypothetical protein